MSTTALSPLEAANVRLLALRAILAADEEPSASPRQENSITAPESNIARRGNGTADLYSTLPSHLGWGSEPVTAHLRPSADPIPLPADRENRETAPSIPAIVPTISTPSPAPANINLYPDIALALLRDERVADGRLWLLLRALDEQGRGVWTRHTAYEKLTRDDAPYWLCGERQLRKLLERGEGLFWHQDKQKRIWLCSQAKVAAALGIGRLQHKPVALPVSILCQPIGDVRAHLYASFHSIRSGGEKQAMPISRQTLTMLSGVCPRTQQAYEMRARVQATACIAVGAVQEPVSSRVETPVLSRVEVATSTQLSASVSSQEEMWKNGRAGFRFCDHLGKQGERGKIYHARRLPNRYSGPHAAASGRGRRRLNRQLTDLRQKGAGNGQVTASQAELGRQSWTRRYAADGASGAKMWGKSGGKRPIYWHGRSQSRGIIIWQTLPELDG